MVDDILDIRRQVNDARFVQRIQIAACFDDGTYSCLTEPPSLVGGFLLSPGFGLGTPRWCYTAEDFIAVLGREVDKASFVQTVTVARGRVGRLGAAVSRRCTARAGAET